MLSILLFRINYTEIYAYSKEIIILKFILVSDLYNNTCIYLSLFWWLHRRMKSEDLIPNLVLKERASLLIVMFYLLECFRSLIYRSLVKQNVTFNGHGNCPGVERINVSMNQQSWILTKRWNKEHIVKGSWQKPEK